ncbi:MAG TPA: hypothetical protein DCZ92_14090 [Elusimicrobia bacterium]|nr:hypothetical protein [Elusimicrobiota bacterium]
MKICTGLLLAAVWGLAGGAAYAQEGRIDALHRLNADAESKIQAQVLDSLLGRGKAYVFLETKAEIKSSADEESKSGTGEIFIEGNDEAAAKGVEKREGKDDKKKQTASHKKKSRDKKDVFVLKLRAMKLNILHDAAVPAEKLKAAKEALVALYPGALKPEDVVFVPAAFLPEPGQAAASAN